MLKPKSDKDRQTGSQTEILLGKCVDSHFPKLLALRKGQLWAGDHQKVIYHICTYGWMKQCISGYMFDCGISVF